eukprot:Lithocolla_globosa_v1_NODE_751_length_3332_cov_13.747635.p2 type:complete len:131 gc:universal NODE_751_length_3332_cov_13.747635:1540-1932(+)
MYFLASTLSKAFVTQSKFSKKSSPKTSSVSNPTRSLRAEIWFFKSGLISHTAAPAHSDFNWPTFTFLKRNCLLRLERSIVSMSVTVIFESIPNPIKAQFFNISQPMAPEPTRNCLYFWIFFWNSLPKTAI